MKLNEKALEAASIALLEAMGPVGGLPLIGTAKRAEEKKLEIARRQAEVAVRAYVQALWSRK